MAHKILVLFLVTLTVSSLLAKGIGKSDGIGRPDENMEDEDRMKYHNGGGTYFYAPPKDDDAENNSTVSEPEEPEKPEQKPFSGDGYTLDGPTNDNDNENDEKPDDHESEIANQNEENEKLANEKLTVDASKPTTSIQVRLADGTRLSVRLNLSHTINDLRTFIANARPQYATQAFILMTNFPNKELTNLDQTIEQAGLKNAVVMQRLQ